MAFTRGQRSEAYDVVIAALMDDATMRREIKSWKVGRGTREEQALEPSAKTRPMITLMPMTGRAGFADTCSFRTSLVIQVKIDLDSGDNRRLLDLWEHLESVILGIEDWGDSGVISAIPELGRNKLGDDNSIVAEGVITLDQFLDR